MSTYTFVRYFDEHDVDGLHREMDKLDADLEKRKEFMTDEAYRAASDRLAVICLQINMLIEPVPRPFGG